MRQQSADSHIGIGIIGLGHIGRVHARAVLRSRPDARCSLLGVCVPPGKHASLADHSSQDALPESATVFTDPSNLFDDDRISLVIIATPTDSHVDLAIAAMKAGKHVLCEKPIALEASDVRRVAELAYTSRVLCIPAMCMRFAPAWSWLKEQVKSGAFGAVKSVTFQRVGPPPDWSPHFFADVRRSGGALFDLHIHDADAVYWLFGRPDEVYSTGTSAHVTTIYRYEATRGRENVPTHVVAEGGQDFAPGFAFRSRFSAAFEDASADYDLTRTPQLLLHQSGTTTTVPLAAGDMFDHQLAAALDAIRRGLANDEVTSSIDDAVAVTAMLEAEKASIDRGRAMPV